MNNQCSNNISEVEYMKSSYNFSLVKVYVLLLS